MSCRSADRRSARRRRPRSIGQEELDRRKQVVERLAALEPDCSSDLEALAEEYVKDLGPTSERLTVVLDAMLKRGQERDRHRRSRAHCVGLRGARALRRDPRGVRARTPPPARWQQAFPLYDEDSDVERLPARPDPARAGEVGGSAEIVAQGLRARRHRARAPRRHRARSASSTPARQAPALIERLESRQRPRGRGGRGRGTWDHKAAVPALEELAASEWAQRSDVGRRAALSSRLTPARLIESRASAWHDAAWKDWNGSWGSMPSSRPPTATSAPRSTTRSASSPPTRSGLTPVVFVITGLFFLCTAATYAEATAMFPEAGGSSSFARRAFNEFWSFFAAWGQMLNYVVTVAISAFFVPHYIGSVFWEALRHSPGDIIAGAIIIAVLAVINVVRGQGVGGAEHRARGRRLPHPGPARHRRRRARVRRQPGPADRERRARRGADVEGLHPRDPDRDDRLHGHRDDLEHGRGGARRGQDDPGGDQARGDRRLRDLLHAAGRRARGAARPAGSRDGRVLHAARPPGGGGRLRGRPDRRARREPRPRPVPDAGGDLRRHPRGDDPVPGHQRGADRRLAARVLDGHPPPAARPIAPAAPALPHAVDRDHRLRRRRDPDHAARPGDVPGQPVRVRGDAVVHDRAPRADPPADVAPRPGAALPAAGQHRATSRCSRSSAGSAPPRRSW